MIKCHAQTQVHTFIRIQDNLKKSPNIRKYNVCVPQFLNLSVAHFCQITYTTLHRGTGKNLLSVLSVFDQRKLSWKQNGTSRGRRLLLLHGCLTYLAGRDVNCNYFTKVQSFYYFYFEGLSINSLPSFFQSLALELAVFLSSFDFLFKIYKYFDSS